ncbi:hypothetical protein ABZV91_16140 [Nocardia sp. NPDC004568]|uniref:hypothetical protein n=1 Tax=Nocardia sp. NPDC004568 TaxID=3154551 RepID=UPI0033B6BC07
MTAGLLCGAVSAAVRIAAPGQTYRLISSLPGLPADLARALHTWLSSGVVLSIGVLPAGAGIAVALLHRRGLPGRGRPMTPPHDPPGGSGGGADAGS